MIYILILAIYGSGSVTSQKIEFPTQQSCDQAGMKAVNELQIPYVNYQTVKYSCLGVPNK